MRVDKIIKITLKKDMKVMSMPSGLEVFKCDYTTVLLNSPIICVKKFSITAET